MTDDQREIRRRLRILEHAESSGAVRKTIQAYPMVPALKRLCAHFWDDEEWARVRPPMVPLDAEKSARLLADLETIGWRLAGIDSTMSGAREASGRRCPT